MKIDLSGHDRYIKEHEEPVDLEFRPSSAKRWFTCPASTRMSSHFGEDTTTDAALEGTLAHKVAEILLRHRLYPDGNKPKLEDDVSKAMVKHINKYVSRVEKLVNLSSCELFIEQTINYDLPNNITISGTCDLLIVDYVRKHIRIIDLKYGRMKVNLTNNHQLNIYALLATKIFDKYENVTIQIMQPRISHYPSIDLDKHYLLKFERKLISKISECLKPYPKFVSGDHCYYCPAKDKCSAYQLPTFNHMYGY